MSVVDNFNEKSKFQNDSRFNETTELKDLSRSDFKHSEYTKNNFEVSNVLNSHENKGDFTHLKSGIEHRSSLAMQNISRNSIGDEININFRRNEQKIDKFFKMQNFQNDSYITINGEKILDGNILKEKGLLKNEQAQNQIDDKNLRQEKSSFENIGNNNSHFSTKSNEDNIKSRINQEIMQKDKHEIEKYIQKDFKISSNEMLISNNSSQFQYISLKNDKFKNDLQKINKDVEKLDSILQKGEKSTDYKLSNQKNNELQKLVEQNSKISQKNNISDKTENSPKIEKKSNFTNNVKLNEFHSFEDKTAKNSLENNQNHVFVQNLTHPENTYSKSSNPTNIILKEPNHKNTNLSIHLQSNNNNYSISDEYSQELSFRDNNVSHSKSNQNYSKTMDLKIENNFKKELNFDKIDSKTSLSNTSLSLKKVHFKEENLINKNIDLQKPVSTKNYDIKKPIKISNSNINQNNIVLKTAFQNPINVESKNNNLKKLDSKDEKNIHKNFEDKFKSPDQFDDLSSKTENIVGFSPRFNVPVLRVGNQKTLIELTKYQQSLQQTDKCFHGGKIDLDRHDLCKVFRKKDMFIRAKSSNKINSNSNLSDINIKRTFQRNGKIETITLYKADASKSPSTITKTQIISNKS